MRVINSDFDKPWIFVQLTARLHGALYSLRMLKQYVAVWLAINPDPNHTNHDSMSSLHKDIAPLPSITKTLIVPGQAKRVLACQEPLWELMEEIYTSGC
jgi:hypothetical protein